MKKLTGVLFVMSVLVMAFVTVPDADAKGSYMNNFNGMYGTDNTRLDSCGVCHYDFGGGGPKNPYGEDFAASGHDFTIIEGIDSDGDGYLNSEEIAVLFMPGLACDNLGSTSSAPADIADYADAGNPGCTGVPVDTDYDGYTNDVDCDDSDPDVNPGASEDCTDGIDNDCDNLVDSADPDAVNCPPACTDADTDTYNIDGGNCGPVDCNDSNPSINPGAVEDCYNGIDDDCDTLIDSNDTDCIIPVCSDYTTKSACNEDLNCTWAGNPRNGSCQDAACTVTEDPEVSCSDGIDNDCDGDVDSSDADCGGGTTEPEVCNDGIDNDGDGKTDCADKKDCNKDPAC